MDSEQTIGFFGLLLAAVVLVFVVAMALHEAGVIALTLP